MLRARPRPGPGLLELRSGPEAPPNGLPAVLAPLTPGGNSPGSPSLHPSQALPPTELLLARFFLSLHFLKGLPGEHTGPSNPSGTETELGGCGATGEELTPQGSRTPQPTSGSAGPGPGTGTGTPRSDIDIARSRVACLLQGRPPLQRAQKGALRSPHRGPHSAGSPPGPLPSCPSGDLSPVLCVCSPPRLWQTPGNSTSGIFSRPRARKSQFNFGY